MKEYISNNQKETAQIANDLADRLEGGELIALSGNLGAGKTVFVKALAKALKIKEQITSPTFVLMKVYDIHSVKSSHMRGAAEPQFNGVKHKKADKFVHVDCYRLRGQDDLYDIGLGDYLNYDNIIVAIEWADKIVNLPERTIRVDIKLLEGDKRKITILWPKN
ncbi:tRNA (adenosine(37)-N6)-threonylcarbamoyltransferase complex ATPase subunit type 1 TsaE [Patescibacteria group bacterium]|nr:tRNA (adenosine(37)-N6)-threonylcarbamoyltransferase complex ATPase subunit type 1 TsaE [Patescibacteria group bacterium]